MEGFENEVLLLHTLVAAVKENEQTSLDAELEERLNQSNSKAAALIVLKDDTPVTVKYISRSHLNEKKRREDIEKLSKLPESNVLETKSDGNYLYRFRLDQYGYLILEREQPFNDKVKQAFSYTAEHFGKSIYHHILIQKNAETQKSITRYDNLLRGLAAATNKLLEAHDYKNAINESLMIIGEASGTDRTYLFTVDEPVKGKPESVSQQFEWNSGRSEPQINNPELQNLPISAVDDTVGELKRGNNFEAVIREMPDTSPTKPVFEAQNIKSILLIPVKRDNTFWGFIGYDDCQNERVWTDAEKSLLKSFSAAISKAAESIQSRKKLSESNRLLKTVTENARDIIGLSDLNGNFKYISSSVENILGYKPEDIKTDSFIRTLRKYVPVFKIGRSALTCTNQKKEVKKVITHHFPHKSGTMKWLETSMVFIPDSSSSLPMIQLVSRDITERMKLLKEKEANAKKEKELIDLRKLFVSMASHQFRTPLTIIQSNIELFNLSLQKVHSRQNDKSRQLMDKATERIKKQIRIMGSLMNDILILGKANEKVINPKLKTFDIVSFVSEVAADFDTPEKINVHCDEHSVFIKTDKKLLGHSLQNLIENSLKYTPGSNPLPEIHIYYPHPDILSIKVTDRGIGIEEDDLKNITKTFYRGKNVQDIEGTGLGLSIVKEFTEALNGKFIIRSRPGKGTVTEIQLPYKD